jgi:hypothetical protein
MKMNNPTRTMDWLKPMGRMAVENARGLLVRCGATVNRKNILRVLQSAPNAHTDLNNAGVLADRSYCMRLLLRTTRDMPQNFFDHELERIGIYFLDVYASFGSSRRLLEIYVIGLLEAEMGANSRPDRERKVEQQ